MVTVVWKIIRRGSPPPLSTALPQATHQQRQILARAAAAEKYIFII